MAGPTKRVWTASAIAATVAMSLVSIAMVTGAWLANPVLGLGVLGFLLVAFGGAFALIAWAGRQKKALQALAAQQGWTFVDADRTDRPNRYLGLVPIRGYGQASNIFVGRHDGLPFEAFTFAYTEGSGKNQHTVSHAVVAVRAPVAGPDLRIQGEGFGRKIQQAVGGGGADIDFESDAFSRAFWVTSPDRKFAYDVVTPAMMDWLLARSNGWQWQWRGPWLIAFKPGTLGPKNALPAVQLVRGFVARVPRNVLASATGRAPPGPLAAKPFDPVAKVDAKAQVTVEFARRMRRGKIVLAAAAGCFPLAIALLAVLGHKPPSPWTGIILTLFLCGFLGVFTGGGMLANAAYYKQLRYGQLVEEKAMAQQMVPTGRPPRTP